MTEKPFHHLHISENVHFDMDAANAVASITQKYLVQRVKQMDTELMKACLEIAKDAGITDVYLINEDFVLNALKRQMPMDPDSHEHMWHMYHNCPVCGNNLKSPGVLQFKNGSYCDQCGQKIQWGDCSD